MTLLPVEGSAPARRDSMPELRSSSNSSASSVSDSGTPPLAPFLAAQNFQQDDGDEAWEDDDAPSITIGSRRARPGNDSGDADRDRRPPAQRTGEMHQTSRPTSGRQISGQRTQPRHPPTAQPHPPNVHFQNTIPVSPGDIHGLFGGIMNAFGGAIQGQGAPVMHFTQELPPGSPNVQQWFTNLFAGLGSQPEHSDPARARRMVRLLEPVPEGLVQRLQRLQEIGQAEEGDLMCAVCWESLLSEGGGFADVASGERNENEMQGVQNTPPADNDNEEDTGELPKIVTLPCSHTFHSSCLLPWFSQPRGTTCPTCRFELDPNGDLTARLPTPAGGQGFATVQPPWRPVRMTPGGPAPRIKSRRQLSTWSPHNSTIPSFLFITTTASHAGTIIQHGFT
ncbi:hypothetical protein DL96DRAFT_675754 [Flagelloscypha sp. PMI_526]|nr:hypothetical protein DL96DRAFT_675754 [Flagelloscypha sp. PMI_526]